MGQSGRVERRENSLPLPGFKPSTIQRVASCCIDYVIPAVCLIWLTNSVNYIPLFNLSYKLMQQRAILIVKAEMLKQISLCICLSEYQLNITIKGTHTVHKINTLTIAHLHLPVCSQKPTFIRITMHIYKVCSNHIHIKILHSKN